MKKCIGLVGVVFLLVASVHATVVDFAQIDGSAGSGTTWGDSDFTIVHRAGAYETGATVSSEISSLMFHSTAIGKTKTYIEELDSTQDVFGDISSVWVRSFDVKLGNAAIYAYLLDSQPRFLANVLDSAWIGLYLWEADGTTGNIRFERQNAGNLGSYERYSFSNGGWIGSDTLTFDLSHTLNVTYTYDPAASSNQFSVTIMDKTAETVLGIGYSDIADMAGVSASDPMFLTVGDIIENSISDAEYYVDTVSSQAAPGPAEDLGVSFAQADGTVSGGTIWNYLTHSFVYRASAYDGGSVDTEITNQTFHSTATGKTKTYIEELLITRTVFGSIDYVWNRSLDVKLNNTAVYVSLLESRPGTLADVVNSTWVGLYVWETDGMLGNIRFERENAGNLGSFERYNFADGDWLSSDTLTYDLSHTLTITYTYNPNISSNQFAVTIVDKTLNTVLGVGYSDVADMAGVLSSDKIFLTVGDPVENGLNDAEYFIDNIYIAVEANSSASFTAIEHVPGDQMKLTIAAAGSLVGYTLVTCSDLAGANWSAVAHSDNGVNAFAMTNLTYSSLEGTNVVIYVESTDTKKFYGLHF